MILSIVLLALAVLAIVLAVEKLRLPVFLAIMATIVAYGFAARMTFHSVGKAFGLGFVQALEQAGLLVIAGALLTKILARAPLGSMGAAGAGVLAGLGGSATAGLSLLQPVTTGASVRTVGLVLTLLATHALMVPSPIAVAALSVLRADFSTAALIAGPAAMLAIGVGWFVATSLLRDEAPRGGDSWVFLAVAIPVVLLVVQAVAQMPTEPLGKGGARELYTGISSPLMLAALALVLAIALTWRWPGQTLTDTSWAPLLLAVGAAGGLSRVLDETGTADLIAELAMRPGLGLAAPFFAAAIVKTLQGNSLSAVLTAAGMTEPMLGALGLDSASGRALAAASAGAGAIAITHLNDPLFWIAAHMAGLKPGRALLVISLGSAAVAFTALSVLLLLRLVL